MKVFFDGFDLCPVLERTRTFGYAFVTQAVRPELCQAMEEEIERLEMEVGDHVAHPINRAAPNEVRQQHERAYRPLDHPDVPVATEICRSLARDVADLRFAPELDAWLPSEIGYQRYRDGQDWISPHRDRASDQLLSVTLTISGAAVVRIHEAMDDPPDYTRLNVKDTFLTEPGTVMFLRAPGFGSGQRVIHEVMPPQQGTRCILNLRMRPTILKPPSETRWR